jgi:hypothetical protein
MKKYIIKYNICFWQKGQEMKVLVALFFVSVFLGGYLIFYFR